MTKTQTTPGVLPGGRCSRCALCAPSGRCLDPAIKSGRCGDWVWYVRGNKQCRRRWAKPRDPRTPRQLYWRARLSTASKKYSESLTDEQQDACIAAGAKQRCRPRLGDSGRLTGQQHWVRQECKAKKERGRQSTLPGAATEDGNGNTATSVARTRRGKTATDIAFSRRRMTSGRWQTRCCPLRHATVTINWPRSSTRVANTGKSRFAGPAVTWPAGSKVEP